MATKNTSKNTPKKKRTKSTNTRKKQVKKAESFRGEILLLISFLICVLLTISNFGIGGFVGDLFSSIMFGIFGVIAYIFPILVFVLMVFVLVNQGNAAARIKAGAIVILTMTLCTVFQLFVTGYKPTITFLEYYRSSFEHKNGGGLIGGLLIRVLCPAFGLVGTYIIVSVVAIICLVLITERSFVKVVKKHSKKVCEAASKDMKRCRDKVSKERERRKQEREEKEESKRRDHIVSGVSFDTTLNASQDLPPLVPPQDVQELFQPDSLEITSVNKEQKSDDIVIHREQEPLPINEPVKVSGHNRKTKESRKEIEQDTISVAAEIQKNSEQPQKEHTIPPLSLLNRGKKSNGDSSAHLRQTANKLQQTLLNFNVKVAVTDVSCGPSVTRYELQPEQGVKVSKIVGLADDIKLNLAAPDIRIEAPIPGKAAVGIEVPNKENTAVVLRELLESPEFKNHESNIAFAVGKDIAGKVVVADIMKMPHLLIAGATGSGKSVCINTLIMSILYKADPKDVKLIMIDPKVVELSVYNGIPHLLVPVVTDPKKAATTLNWAVVEMMKRYEAFAKYNVRDLKGYNSKVVDGSVDPDIPSEKMAQIVIIVDELADLMMVAPGEVEESICRLAQLARAAGIHLVLATQRPSVNVITGLIKANMPSRIAFSVSSGVDSRTIIDMNGAEKLLGKGDMLFYPSGYQKPARVQGAFVSDKEVQDVVDFLVKHSDGTHYNEEITEHMNQTSGFNQNTNGSTAMNRPEDDRDVYFLEAGKFIIEKDKASIGMLQRVFKIGFNRAARIMGQLAEAGVVGEEEGTKPRKVLMTMEQFESSMNAKEDIEE